MKALRSRSTERPRIRRRSHGVSGKDRRRPSPSKCRSSPAFTVATPGGSLPKEYAALYLTPGVRLTVHPDALVSVFGSVGGGYARYSESKERANGSPNPNQRDTNTGAVQFGGGVDVRALQWLAFRGEVRDVNTGARNFSIVTPHNHVHNVVVSGGFVLRF